MIFALIVGGILLVFTKDFSHTVEKGGDRNACHTSVLLKAKNPLKAGELNCKTDSVLLDTFDQQKIMKTVAEEAYWCWWQFGEGQLDFIDMQAIQGKGNIMCFLCADIQFSDKAKAKYPQGINGFSTYLKETSLQPKYDGSYADYLPLPSDTPLDTISTQSGFRIAFFGSKIREFSPNTPFLFALGPFDRLFVRGMLYSTGDIKEVCDEVVIGEPLS